MAETIATILGLFFFIILPIIILIWIIYKVLKSPVKDNAKKKVEKVRRTEYGDGSISQHVVSRENHEDNEEGDQDWDY